MKDTARLPQRIRSTRNMPDRALPKYNGPHTVDARQCLLLLHAMQFQLLSGAVTGMEVGGERM